jgi:glycosyltransferase involved in cell wall biosynthesis
MARALERANQLRFIALGTRRGIAGVPLERTRLNPLIGLSSYIAAKMMSPFKAESFSYRQLPWFDRWALKQLEPGDHIISSYGLVNECFKFVHAHGGKRLVEAGNSHIENIWAILSEEHRRWNCPYPPGPPFWHERAKAMMADGVDFVISPSSYVTNSFLARGFKPEQILNVIFPPFNFSLFYPARETRPKDRPLTLINTGSLSLRKGTPYLLEAFRIVRSKIPNVRLRLRRNVEDSVAHILPKYGDLPIEWLPVMPYAQLAEHLRDADIFILPSLEEGLARAACEAMACGLPIIVTSHTGANDFVQSGVNGEVVPIRNAQATADAVLKWADKILSADWQPRILANLEPLSLEHFEKNFITQLQRVGLT